MRRGVKIFLSAIIIIVIATAALCVWQRENLRAVYMLLTQDEESLSLSAADITEIPDASASDAPLLSPEDTSAEQSTSSSGAKRSARTSSTSSSSGEKETAKSGQSPVEKCRAELVACEAQLVTRVAGMRDEVLAEWRALPSEERTSRRKREMIVSGIGRCLSLEGEIDGKVKAIIAKYRAELKDAGEDTSALDTLWNEYTSKKASTKAYYLNKYLK